MSQFVLIPGAWHGAWCWERVIPLLTARGHHVQAPELLGMGEDRAHAAAATLDAWAEQVAGIVRAAPEPVILVGHSRGGTIISEVAERVPERIATLVYLAAMLLRSGDSIATSGARVPRDPDPDLLRQNPDGTCTIEPSRIVANFYNTTPASWGERAALRLGPEPIASLVTPVSVTAERFGHCRRAYIECVQDRAVPLPLQRIMQADWPCETVVTLDTDHSPFYSDPEALADALHRIATSLEPA